eukprot:TRINITY_DN13396_c0_g1_i10.p1 TRINITY_DN13396_c0_g1~~TRINITY_DN13396_c0_g1_i10.p1  ORF type:complete len:490 (-),score=87.32 TRINITY_DN13396_c0_g1_i10:184-1653(-)
MAAVIPGGLEGYDDASSDDGFDFGGKDYHHNSKEPYNSTSNNNNDTNLTATKTDGSLEDYNFDLDIKEIIDESDIEVLAESVTSGCISVNHNLMSCYGWSLATYAASRANPKVLRWLFEHSGKIGSSNNREPITGFLALSQIQPEHVTSQQIVETAQLLLDQGDDIGKPQSQMKTPLMLAASEGNLPLTKFLIDHKAELDKTDSQLWTALMYGSDGGHGDVVRTLLEAGASPHQISAQGHTAADIAAIQNNYELQEVLQKFSSLTQLSWKRDDAKKPKNREMANILSGLNLDEYQDTFEEHNIGISEFLVISEEEMIQMGIAEIGSRKRLLEGQVQAHKRAWSKQSLPLPPLTDQINGLRLTCPEAGAILYNIDSHLQYLAASVSYIRLQVRDHGPRLLKAGSDLISPSDLRTILNKCRLQADRFDRECAALRSELYLREPSGSPANLENIEKRNLGVEKGWKLGVVSASVFLSGLAVLVHFRHNLLFF